MSDSRLYVSWCLITFSAACGNVKPERASVPNSGGQFGSAIQASAAAGAGGNTNLVMTAAGSGGGSLAAVGGSLVQNGGSGGGVPSGANAATGGQNAGGQNAGGTGGGWQASGTAGAETAPDPDAVCKQACNKLLGASCGDLIADDCATCAFKNALCQREIDAVQSCTVERGTATCRGESTVTEGCDAEQQAVDVCRACEAGPDDASCWTCTITSCCGEQQAFVAAPDYPRYDSCMRSCDSAPCYDDCGSAFPVAAAAYQKVDVCRQASCTSECSP